jgi:adenine deaminase
VGVTLRTKGSFHTKAGTDESLVAMMQRRVEIARGDKPAEIVVRNAKWLDVFSGAWQSGDVAISDGVIVGVRDSYEARDVVDGKGCFLVPGFIDAHVHVESSMMTPSKFASAVLPRGTTTVIWDPHEIANVKGLDGIRWALDSTEDLPVDFFVMIPSCVPSTSPELGLESSGARLLSHDLKEFIGHPRVLGLAEMMNWPGLVGGDKEVMTKLALFAGHRRDGHCPGLSGKALNAYGVAGIHSCHESTTITEGAEKLSKGIHVLIREGSCAKDADVLLPLLTSYSSATLGYCSDDRNPLDIEESGHLDCIINKGLTSKLDSVAVFRASSFAVAKMYGLDDRGAIAPGYRADVALVRTRGGGDDFSKGVEIVNVWKEGRSAPVLLQKMTSAKVGSAHFSGKNLAIKQDVIESKHFKISTSHKSKTKARVIGVRPGQIVTDELHADFDVSGDELIVNAASGINKITVIERHHKTGFMTTAIVKGFSLKSGAIATSINHDCHNVIVTGSSDELMAKAVQELRRIDGGIVVVSSSGEMSCIELPIGGLMTDLEPKQVAQRLRELKRLAHSVGCRLEEPFLQLSFLALPVIPSLKLTDRGLVDGHKFQIVPVEI